VDFRIRGIREDELEAWIHATELAFSDRLDHEEIEVERSVAEVDRSMAAFDGEDIVGTAAAVSLQMAVPGGRVLPVAGVTMVGVRPTHRRRGINTTLMRRLLEQARERGEPLSALFASESSIYGRFGYGLASFSCAIDLETDRAAFVPSYRPTGRVRLQPRDEAIPTLVEVYGRSRHARPGTIDMDERRFRWWLHPHHWEKDDPAFVAVHEGADGPDAYALYHVKHEWPGSIPQLVLTADDVQAADPQAYADIWRFLLDVDLVSRVQAWGRPPDEPLMFLLAEPRRLRLTVKDGLWLRPVDVRSALAARGYAAEGRVVFDVRDRFCGWNEGRYRLEAGSGGAACASTDADPDLSCSVNALGAAYLGGASFRQLWRAGQVVEERPGALARADALFASDPAPWCPFVF
jgi:predicted acetyltransferase